MLSLQYIFTLEHKIHICGHHILEFIRKIIELTLLIVCENIAEKMSAR